mmetsp:Transcript_4276/g.5553  ORF Transcript_4276/g.5553 Transcript_4276/m.5553 type:complete len:854 (+) Transcript_4276:183-2744(+)
MRLCGQSALSLFVLSSSTSAFAPSFTHLSTSVRTVSVSSSSRSLISSNAITSIHLNSLTNTSTSTSTSSSRLYSTLGNRYDDTDSDDEDYDSDSDDDDDDLKYASKKTSTLTSPGNYPKLDPHDPNPPIKPRPGRYGYQSLEVEADESIDLTTLKQTMSSTERAENLKIMRQIKKFDLADLRLRKDHAGWVDANNDLKERTKSDPWYRVNDLIKDGYLLGEDSKKMDELKAFAEKLGGPPPGVKVNDKRGYALHTDIYDIGISAGRTASALEQSILEERVKRGRAMAAERAKNMEKEQKQWEDMMRNPGDREDKEAAERRERTMARLRSEIEEDTKKREERAKEMLGQLPEMPKDSAASLESALEEAREDVKRLRQMRKEGRGLGEVSDDADLTFMNPEDRLAAEDAGITSAGTSSSGSSSSDSTNSDKMGSAAKAREAAEAATAGGRPRLPGDEDVTRGEITTTAESSSTTTTGPLTVAVTSTYNTEQSDPPMRKHCFQYTIRITNNSQTDTIQLLSRRFEIQTVGSSMKDVVQGEGVTGRTPILKPGEVFEYTSTAPLSVRPIATTIIAARMKGEYNYVTLSENQETATPDQIKQGGDDSAKLGMFHFVFPEEQRVKPITSSYEDDDDDDTSGDDDKSSTTTTTISSSSSAKAVSPPADSSASTSKSSSSSTSDSKSPPPVSSPASTLPGDSDMSSGNVPTSTVSDSSNLVTENVRVQVSSIYRPERSDKNLEKHCFAYSVRITNESSSQNIQLVSRRFEIQTVGSETKDVVQGPGVTGRQPILKPGESFEYTSTAPLSVKPLLEKTDVVARMEGEYNFVLLGDDGSTPISSTPLQAKMGQFHFILPEAGK